MGCSGGCKGSRSGKILFLVGPVPMSLRLAGPTETEVLDAQGREIEPTDLTRDTQLSLRWIDARFYGRHWLLGNVLVSLNSEAESSSGVVRPLGDLHQERDQAAFYPAHNANELYFRIRIPRFGLSFVNDDPVRNSAEVSQIPPYDSPYRLSQPVRFRSTSWLPLPIRILACIVETMREEGLEVRVLAVERSGNQITITFEVVNQTVSDRVEVVWSLQALPGLELRRGLGIATLRRRPKRIKATLKSVGFTGRTEVCVRCSVLRPAELSAAGSADAVVEV